MIYLIASSIDSETYIIEEEDPVNMTHHPYVQDYQCLQQAREEMLVHYGYSSSFRKVEKRSFLRIEEFWDLYDGKW